MTQQEPEAPYEVVLLVEEALSEPDARQVVSLHDELGQPVRYHVLLPAEDAAMRVEAAMGSLAAGEVMASPTYTLGEIDLEEVRRETLARTEAELATTLERLRALGATAVGEVATAPPVQALQAKVAAVGGREAIILTRPHVVAELFHVDWTSRARRHLGVPVLHLLEHESLDEQAGGAGEGATGL